jgi:Aspartyl protease
MDLTTGRPVITATLKEGGVARFIFDTGAQNPSLTPEAVSRLNLAVIGKSLVGSPMGGVPMEVPLVRLEGLKLGSTLSTQADASVLKMLPANSQNLDGVLGPGAFRDSIVEIDLKTNGVRLVKSPTRVPAVWHGLDERNMPSTTMDIGGQSLPVTLDTGNPHGVMLSKAFVSRIKPDAVMTEVGRVRTIDADIPRYRTNLDMTARIGDIELPLGEIDVADIPSNGANLGNKVLQGLTIVIDNPNRRWGLVR